MILNFSHIIVETLFIGLVIHIFEHQPLVKLRSPCSTRITICKNNVENVFPSSLLLAIF